MLISIIIPAYNAEKYLDDCLSSCYRQDVLIDDYEIILINDGSTDRTLDIAKKWASDHGNIRIISQENKGLSEARNIGIANAEGEYIMFIDSDDWIADNCFRHITSTCKEYNLDMYRFSAANVINGEAKRRFTYKMTDISTGCGLLKDNFQVCAPFSIYSRDFLIKNSLKFYPGVFHEDNLFTPMAYYMAGKVGTTNDIIYFVRQTPGSITRSTNPKKSHDLLKIICLLEEFIDKSVKAEYKKYFHKQISDCLNVCFRNMLELPAKAKSELKEKIRKGRVLRHLLLSSSISHKIEGVLISICPCLMLNTFKVLDKLRRN